MKKILLGLGFALMASVSLMSCSKGEYNSGDLQKGKNPFSEENNKPKPKTNGVFTAKINGVTFTADIDKAFAYGDAAKKIWIINGFKGVSSYPQGFSLSITKSEKGTYNIDFSNPEAPGTAVYQAEGSSSAVVAQTGKIVITDISETKIVGTFDMNAAGIDVTEGSFNLPIITQP